MRSLQASGVRSSGVTLPASVMMAHRGEVFRALRALREVRFEQPTLRPRQGAFTVVR
jgi:hypothetical protein